jgi:hypothetical protein
VSRKAKALTRGAARTPTQNKPRKRKRTANYQVETERFDLWYFPEKNSRRTLILNSISKKTTVESTIPKKANRNDRNVNNPFPFRIISSPKILKKKMTNEADNFLVTETS